MKCFAALAITAVALALAAPAGAAEFDKFAIESVGAALSSSQAGAHPDFTNSIRITTEEASGAPFAQTRDISVDLPPGLLANANAFPKCTTLQLNDKQCPQDSQIGVVEALPFGLGTLVEPIYNMVRGESVARLGFIAGVFPVLLNAHVRSESDYGATASGDGIPSAYALLLANTTIWGVPADPSHDALRITPFEAINNESPPGGGRASSQPPTPFTINPTRCGVPLEVDFTARSYQLPDQPSSMSAPLGSIGGCGKLSFEPSLIATPSSREAAAPSGLDVTVALPQNETPNGLATSQIRDARVSLPEAMTVAPGAADGQAACDEKQAGYKSRQPAHCPDASKLGTTEFDVPLLERPLRGAVYLRTPEPGNLFRIWLIADDLGAHIALPGQLVLDKTTGQISSALIDMPQAPVHEAKLHFFGGSRGALATPSSCGTYKGAWQFTPWSGTEPVQGDAPMTFDRGCDTGGFDPKLSVGVTSPTAGAFSPLVTELTRQSNEQNVARLDVTLPTGVSAKLAGVALCEGAAAQSGRCPPASQIGSATVAAGPGPAPLWLPQPGKDPISVYLSGPYKGAPYSIVVRAPAQAGPFDLGTVVTRAAIDIDPETARATASSDPLPQILEGVRVSYRTIHVDVNRAGFSRNPTNCEPKVAQAKVTSDRGVIAGPTAAFQVRGCSKLAFKPKLSLRLFGKTNRGAHPKLRAVLKARPKDANIARAQVALPHSEFLDQAHIRTVCTRVQFAAEQCPKGSIYGHVRAFTPLLDQPLEGPVYLRSSSHPLPDLVIALKGQIEVDAVGRIDSINGGIRTTFQTIPDAPISKVVFTMEGGDKGLLVNSRNICANSPRASVSFSGHNGKQLNLRPLLNASCTR